jgi:hypothetical protein
MASLVKHISNEFAGETVSLLSSDEELSGVGQDDLIQQPSDSITKPLLCWRNPPVCVGKTRERCGFEHVVIGVVLLFILSAAITFAFISEEEAGILDLQAVSLNYPLVRRK